MKTLLSVAAAAVVAATLVCTLGATVGCAGLSKAAAAAAHNANGNKATAKSAKDVAACEKMCAVAGDAEDNKAAVEKCQKKCGE